MPELHAELPEALMLARLEQAEQMRAFFLQMWLENPALAKGAGARIQAMLQPLAPVPPAPSFSRKEEVL